MAAGDLFSKDLDSAPSQRASNSLYTLVSPDHHGSEFGRLGRRSNYVIRSLFADQMGAVQMRAGLDGAYVNPLQDLAAKLQVPSTAVHGPRHPRSLSSDWRSDVHVRTLSLKTSKRKYLTKSSAPRTYWIGVDPYHPSRVRLLTHGIWHAGPIPRGNWLSVRLASFHAAYCTQLAQACTKVPLSKPRISLERCNGQHTSWQESVKFSACILQSKIEFASSSLTACVVRDGYGKCGVSADLPLPTLPKDGETTFCGVSKCSTVHGWETKDLSTSHANNSIVHQTLRSGSSDFSITARCKWQTASMFQIPRQRRLKLDDRHYGRGIGRKSGAGGSGGAAADSLLILASMLDAFGFKSWSQFGAKPKMSRFLPCGI
nr:hypothetical protein CFP56_25841 [Quercus suber]